MATANNLPRFRAVRGLDEDEESQHEVELFMLSFGFRDQRSHLCHAAVMRLCGCAATKVLGFRVRPERATRQPCAKAVEEAFLHTKYCDWQPRKPRAARGSQSSG